MGYSPPVTHPHIFLPSIPSTKLRLGVVMVVVVERKEGSNRKAFQPNPPL